MVGTTGEHALVLGGSIAGLLAARVLADHYATVTIVERDRLPSTATQRRGVPQGQHVHAMLPGGLQIVEGLLPGFTAQVTAAGGLTGDILANVLQAVAHALEAPWRLAVGADLALPGISGPALPDSPLTPDYLRRLQVAATEDAGVAAALVRVTSLIDPPPALLRPEIAERVERATVAAAPRPR